jgi:rhamnosyltransferase
MAATRCPPEGTAMISVVIPVKNGGPGLARCLDAIRAQDIDQQVEIVVVDSGSEDRSLAVAAARSARIHQIPPAAFSHGASRNLGARQAGGELLVFLSQDAVPVGPRWLERLTRPLRDDARLAGVYGRQLASRTAVDPERYFLDFLYGPEARRQRAATVSELSMATTLFSNVNSAIPRALWARFPFVEDIVMSEDQEWSRRVLLAGHEIAYVPDAPVIHSHRYSLAAGFRRFFDSGASSSRAYMSGQADSARVLRSSALRYMRGEIRWLWRTGRIRRLPSAAVYESAKMLGLLAGVNYERIPVNIRRRLSATPSFWE